MSSKRKFLETMYLLYIFGKFFGLSCYSISKGRIKYKVSLGVNDFYRFLAFVLIYLTLIYWNFQLESNSDENNTRIFNQAQQILLSSSLFFLTTGQVFVVLMRRRYWDIANSLNDIDNQMLQRLKIEIDHNTLYRNTIIHLCISYSTLVVIYVIFGYYSFAVNRNAGMIVQYISYVVINGSFVLLTTQFQVLKYSMYMRFSTLNGFVESNILPQTQLKLPSSSSLELQTNILTIAKLTDQLNNLVPLLSQYFFLFTVSCTLGIFCITVFNFHSLFRTISGENSSVQYQMIGIFFSFMIGLSIVISDMNMSAANRMGVLVHKIIARTHNPELILKLKILSMQILHRTPNFSFGLFSMDWQFVFSFVASVASYLVILIQFQGYVDKNVHIPDSNRQES